MLNYPYYYKFFKCKASQCTDSCCMHWEIDIDDYSLNKYLNWPGEFGKKLKDGIYINDEGGHFKMDSSERCVFLNESGLCDLILSIGEEHLCDICHEHPRFYDSFSFGEEVGVGLCCEAAAALILDSSISDEIVFAPASDRSKDYPDSEFLPDESDNSPYLNSAETLLLEERHYLLNEPDYFTPLWDNSVHNTSVSTWAEEFFTINSIKNLCSLLLDLEIVSPVWREIITRLSLCPEEILKQKNTFINKYSFTKNQYKRLTGYFIYRYYMKARFADDFEFEADVKLRFAMISVSIIILLDILKWIESSTFSIDDQINICKLFSQEIEYDEDNTAALEEFCISSFIY